MTQDLEFYMIIIVYIILFLIKSQHVHLFYIIFNIVNVSEHWTKQSTNVKPQYKKLQVGFWHIIYRIFI